MAEGLIYTVNLDGSLQRMTPSAPENEDRMQALVARYPELISDGDGDLLLIRREQTILDGDTSPGRWSIDHLFVTKQGIPVLVELKRAADTRLRREVIGQMLEYAANATAYWQPGKIADSFAKTSTETGNNPDETLANFIGEYEPEAFWSQVDANFRAGRVKLVFVADEISRELARIVEFMNDQMRADVRAIELRWFSSEAGHVTLSPRVIGETERASSAKRAGAALPQLSPKEWIESRIGRLGEDVRVGAEIYASVVTELGGETEVSDTQSSLLGVFRNANGREIYPLQLWSEKGEVSFSLRWLYAREEFKDETLRQELYDELKSTFGPLTTTNLRGFPSFTARKLSEPNKREAFLSWGKKVADVASGRHRARPV